MIFMVICLEIIAAFSMDGDCTWLEFVVAAFVGCGVGVVVEVVMVEDDDDEEVLVVVVGGRVVPAASAASWTLPTRYWMVFKLLTTLLISLLLSGSACPAKREKPIIRRQKSH